MLCVALRGRAAPRAALLCRAASCGTATHHNGVFERIVMLVQMRRKGMSPMMTRKWRDVTEGVGHTSRMAALTRSPGRVRKREDITKSSTSTSLTAMSSDDEHDHTTGADIGRYITTKSC